jgi:hypothetical protein
VTNGNEFNAEIKLSAKERYLESSIYTPKKGNSTFKKGKNALTDGYRHRQNDIASVVFQQESLPGGLIIYLFKSSLENFSFLSSYCYTKRTSSVRLFNSR